MTGELFINNIDVAQEYGIHMANGAYANLIMPPPAKEYVVSESRLESGKRYHTGNMQFDERTISMPLFIKTASREEFYNRLTRFAAEVLATGQLDIRTKYQTALTYHCVYKACTQLTEYNGRLGKLLLQIIEPDTTNRQA